MCWAMPGCMRKTAKAQAETGAAPACSCTRSAPSLSQAPAVRVLKLCAGTCSTLPPPLAIAVPLDSVPTTSPASCCNQFLLKIVCS